VCYLDLHEESNAEKYALQHLDLDCQANEENGPSAIVATAMKVSQQCSIKSCFSLGAKVLLAASRKLDAFDSQDVQIQACSMRVRAGMWIARTDGFHKAKRVFIDAMTAMDAVGNQSPIANEEARIASVHTRLARGHCAIQARLPAEAIEPVSDGIEILNGLSSNRARSMKAEAERMLHEAMQRLG